MLGQHRPDVRLEELDAFGQAWSPSDAARAAPDRRRVPHDLRQRDAQTNAA